MRAGKVALAVGLLAALNGCGGVVMALSAVASTATIAKDVFEVDVAWHQQTPGKTPIATILVPTVAQPAEGTVPAPIVSAPAQMNGFYEER